MVEITHLTTTGKKSSIAILAKDVAEAGKANDEKNSSYILSVYVEIQSSSVIWIQK